ncbi:MAG: enoyl-CoA hydratase [Rhizobiaceae bacterium]|nr:enoyl-CoA hydratase [Rhizobiaceae bacterium]
MAETGLLEWHLEDGVFRLTLNRPEKRNALSLEMIGAISGALDMADQDTSARVIVIAANGPVFSSGHDLKELTAARNNPDRGRDFFDQTMRTCSSMMQKIVNHRLPVIAEVRGTASAAGCQLVASCDLTVASNDSKFITPGVNIGLFCSTPMVALSRNVANKHALEMLLTGEPCSAQKAVEIGLINRAVPAEEVDANVMWFADRISAKSQMTIKTGKQAFYQQTHMPLSDAYEYCAQVMVENMLKHDAEEGINAFLEKREAEWRDE